MTAKYSPGPWEHANDRVYCAGWEIASLLSSAPRGVQREANARLIAAAPKLAEVLKAYLDEDERNEFNRSHDERQRTAAARAALKAAGVLP
mgnify:CR=1 FL=1